MIDGISAAQLHRYYQMRQHCDAEVEIIRGLSSLLSTLSKHADSDRIVIEPAALAHVHALLSRSAANIAEQLDAFISLVEARQRQEGE